MRRLIVSLMLATATVAGCGGSDAAKRYKVICQDPTATYEVSARMRVHTSHGWLLIYTDDNGTVYRNSGTCEVSRLR